MATSLTKFKGGKQLQDFLNTLPAKIEKNIMRSALRQGANVYKDEAKANINDVTGDLSRNVKVKTSGRNGQVRAVVEVKDTKAIWVEFGTAPHLIKVSEDAKPSRRTRHGIKKYSIGTINKMTARGSLVIGGEFVGQSVHHPGAAPHPFMRPAADSKTNEAIAAVGNQVRKRLTKEGINAPAGTESEDE